MPLPQVTKTCPVCGLSFTGHPAKRYHPWCRKRAENQRKRLKERQEREAHYATHPPTSQVTQVTPSQLAYLQSLDETPPPIQLGTYPTNPTPEQTAELKRLLGDEYHPPTQ